MHGAFKFGGGDGWLGICGLPAGRISLATFLSIESQKNIVVHDIGYVIQWLCISTLQ